MDQETILKETAHRPWPLPKSPWAMQMQWLDLAFFHWQVPFEDLRARVPAQLELDTFEGGAWLAIAPFRMANVRMRLAPPIPTATEFEELNVRTYVRANGRAGVWFFSLDAASTLAVAGARFGANLPYFKADMNVRREGDAFVYESKRRRRGESPGAELQARYWPVGPVEPAAPGSLERWLTERYCLFTVARSGKVHELDIHHCPWPLQPAAAEISVNTMAEATGLALPASAPLVHFAKRLDVLAWPPFSVEPG